MTNTTIAASGQRGRIAVALSGGGSRAIAFHLGCLRALHDEGVLEEVCTISAVSGGSVLAALYCSYSGDFASFERHVRSILKRGLLRPAIGVALTTAEGPKALVSAICMIADRCAATLVRITPFLFSRKLNDEEKWPNIPIFLRSASRTTILRRVFSNIFKGKLLIELRDDRPKLIITACELQHKSAFYFTAEAVGSWRLGVGDPANIELADAVAASAAYPGLLPSIDKSMDFTKSGRKSRRRVILTDGGVYDNLGLAPLWPDRDPRISISVGSHDRIIACRAGYGLAKGPVSVFWPSRMLAVLFSALARAENIGVNRLFDHLKSGNLKGVLLPYLGQDDSQIKSKPPGFIAADAVADYPTDFSGMSDEWINKLAGRGDMLTRALLREHWGWKKSRN